MKKFFLLLSLTAAFSASASNSLMADLADNLQGIYAGKNCELKIHTEWYGDGYYKRLIFKKNGKTVDAQSFHVDAISGRAKFDSEGDFSIKFRDEIGSDGEDKYVRVKADFVEVAEGDFQPVNFKYRYRSIGMLVFPISMGSFSCKNMKKVGEGEQLDLETHMQFLD